MAAEEKAHIRLMLQALCLTRGLYMHEEAERNEKITPVRFRVIHNASFPVRKCHHDTK